MKKVKALIIVAHPDDESIWMGGYILKNPEWQWTIFSLCRAKDEDRAPKFMKVCEYYGARGIISDLDDEVLEPVSEEDIVNRIKDKIRDEKFDYVFTHGENGEYGHIRHSEIHRAVKKMAEEGMLECKKLYYFSYVDGEIIAPHDSELRIPVANKEAEMFVKLNKRQEEEKLHIVRDIYGFQEGIFETLSCNGTEAFSLGK